VTVAALRVGRYNPLEARGGTPLYGYMGMSGPNGFLAVLVSNRVWLLYCSLELGMEFLFLEVVTFFIVIDKTNNKSHSFNIDLN